MGILDELEKILAPETVWQNRPQATTPEQTLADQDMSAWREELNPKQRPYNPVGEMIRGATKDFGKVPDWDTPSPSIGSELLSGVKNAGDALYDEKRRMWDQKQAHADRSLKALMGEEVNQARLDSIDARRDADYYRNLNTTARTDAYVRNVDSQILNRQTEAKSKLFHDTLRWRDKDISDLNLLHDIYDKSRKRRFAELHLDKGLRGPALQKAEQDFRDYIEAMDNDPMFAPLRQGFQGSGAQPGGYVPPVPKAAEAAQPAQPAATLKTAFDGQGKQWALNPATGKYDIPVGP